MLKFLFISIIFEELHHTDPLFLHWCLEKLYFIDFEYGSYSYRGFDIGNHFNEYAGYDCDYSLYAIFPKNFMLWSMLSELNMKLACCLYRYPNREEQYHFFKHYLKPEKPHEVCEGRAQLFLF